MSEKRKGKVKTNGFGKSYNCDKQTPKAAIDTGAFNPGCKTVRMNGIPTDIRKQNLTIVTPRGQAIIQNNIEQYQKNYPELNRAELTTMIINDFAIPHFPCTKTVGDFEELREYQEEKQKIQEAFQASADCIN